MSGGHFDYIYTKIREIGGELNPIKSKEERELGKLLIDLSDVLYAVEWYYSGDYSKEEFLKHYKEFKRRWLK